MKKLMYLLVAGTMFVFTACNCGAGDAAETDSVEEVACADDCQKACCLGCKATVGEKKCKVAEDGSHPCCTKVEAAEGEEATEEGAEEADAHEGHDHE